MNLEQALVSQLNISTSITSYTSNRIYPLDIPQGKTMPNIVYIPISDIPTVTNVEDAKISNVRFQISIRSTSYSQLRTLSTAIKNVLRDRKGSLGSSDFIVQRIFYDGEITFSEVNPENKQVNFHRSQEYIIWTTG